MVIEGIVGFDIDTGCNEQRALRLCFYILCMECTRKQEEGKQDKQSFHFEYLNYL